MAKINLYSTKGVKSQSSLALPKDFVGKKNDVLLSQALRVYEWGKHPGLSKVKTRSEVKASGVKIWRQKGTGKARHGALSAPIFVGGGKAHGPKGIKRSLSLSKKMKVGARGALMAIFVEEKRVAAVSGIETIKKTAEAKKMVDAIVKKEVGGLVNKVLVVLSKENAKASKVFKNLPNIDTEIFDYLNAGKLSLYDFLIIEKDTLVSKTAKKTVVKKEEPKKKATKKEPTRKVKSK